MKHPIQPTEVDSRDVLRFKANEIVRNLLDFATSHGRGLNELACMDFSADDRQQFAQLIGYTLGGYGESSYVDDDAFNAAAKMAEDGMSEEQARIATLQKELNMARTGLREPIARLFGIHPDDLK